MLERTLKKAPSATSLSHLLNLSPSHLLSFKVGRKRSSVSKNSLFSSLRRHPVKRKRRRGEEAEKRSRSCALRAIYLSAGGGISVAGGQLPVAGLKKKIRR